MSDFYTEQLVKRKASMYNGGKSCIDRAYSGIASIVFSVSAGDSFLWNYDSGRYFFVPAVRPGILNIYMSNGDLDIDKIMAKQKRKRVFQTNVSELEVIAPTGSAELNAFQNIKAHNFSTMNPDHKTYTMVVVKNGQKEKIILNQIRQFWKECECWRQER